MPHLLAGAVLAFIVRGVVSQCGPGSGDCASPNGTPGCDNEACCSAVCAQDPFCCKTEWDQLCADQVATLCANLPCQPACGKINVACLTEPGFENPGAYANRTAVGKFHGSFGGAMGDCTAWIIAAPNFIITNRHCITTNGQSDGLRASLQDMQIRFNYECTACVNGNTATSFFFNVIDSIPVAESSDLDYAILRVEDNPALDWGVLTVAIDPPFHGLPVYEIHHAGGNVKGYDAGQTTTDVFANFFCQGLGEFFFSSDFGIDVIAGAGTSGAPIFDASSHAVVGICHCGAECSPGYAVALSAILADAQQSIADEGGILSFTACPGIGNCFQSNGTPGCNDAHCCNLVCTANVLCCDVAWDTVCAAAASALCAANDSCSNAIAVSAGQQIVGSLLGASNDGGPSSCSGTSSPINPDVWYAFTAPEDGVLLANTCGTHDSPGLDQGMNTLLSVHPSCPGTPSNALDCSNDWPFGSDPDACLATDLGSRHDSAIALPIQVGELVLIRVTHVASFGDGSFVLNIDFETDCGNGNVDPGEDCESCPKDVQCARGEKCVNGVCESTTGACCFGGGACTPDITQAECASMSGSYGGNGSQCSDCRECIGAGDCDDQNACTSDDCVSGSCVNTPITPCCGNGIPESGEDCANCPPDVPCSPNEECINGVCESFVGACCFAGDICNIDTQSGCQAQGGVYKGNGTDCGDCRDCIDDGDCDDGDPCTSDDCISGSCVNTPITPCCGNGIPEGAEDCANCPADVECAPDEECLGGMCVNLCGNGVADPGEDCASCPQDTFPADLNADGVVNSIDLTIMLACLETNELLCDLNNDGVVNSIDLTIFLSSLGTVCIP